MKTRENVEAMWLEARRYLAGAERLSKSGLETGHSATLLSTLAFEILLKAVYYLSTDQLPKRSHHYRDLWSDLPEPCRRRIENFAAERFGPHAELDELDGKLACLKEAFLKARYSYEENFKRTKGEAASVGEEWIEAGADPDQADFAFYPRTREALIFGLQKVLAEEFGCQMDDRGEIA